jgi:hypothetical protein
MSSAMLSNQTKLKGFSAFFKHTKKKHAADGKISFKMLNLI